MNLYTAAFGMTCLPFQRSLAADQLFRPPVLEELHSRLRYLVDTRAIGLLTGEPGSGKSTALRRLRDELHPDQVRPLPARHLGQPRRLLPPDRPGPRPLTPLVPSHDFPAPPG